MPLAHISLASGREIGLTTLIFDGTYDGLPTDDRSSDVNEQILAELSAPDDEGDPPVHLILPGEEYDPAAPLPAVTVAATFKARPVDDAGHPELASSWLTVVWFADAIEGPIADLVAAVVKDLDWDDLAEDFDD